MGGKILAKSHPRLCFFRGTLTKQQLAEVMDLVSLDLDLQAVLGPRGRSDSRAGLAPLLEDGSHRARVQTIGLQVPDHSHLG